MSDQEPGPTHSPYGQPDDRNPYGQPSPYGQGSGYSSAQPAYGGSPANADKRPGTVTAAAWITIVLSSLTAALFAFSGLALLVARDQVIAEMERVPEFSEAGIDADAAVGVLVAFMVGLVIWCVIAIVLAVFVLRRSNVARILLVISSAVTALGALISVASGLPILHLIGAAATIVLLFTGGAGDWFKRVPASAGGHPGDSSGFQGGHYGTPYGQQEGQGQYDPYGQQSGQPSPPPASDNPYGQQPPASDDPYGQQPPSEGGTDYPPRDYPGR